MARNILIVDDKPEEALPLVRHLRQQGYSVRFANSGTQALRLIEVQRPDFIVCDLEMPDMSGYQVLEAIATNSLTRDIPFILANAEWTMENWSREAGGRTADCHVLKPLPVRDIAVFASRIFQFIEEDADEQDKSDAGGDIP